MNRLIYSLALLILCACTNVMAQQFTTPIKVNNNTGTTSEKSPIMAIGRDGTIYISWVKGSGNKSSIWMSHSTDGGNSFSDAVLACDSSNAPSDMQRTAKFALDTKGGIHMVWMAKRVKNQDDIWYIRSTDKGMSWTTPVTLCDAGDSSKFAQDFPSIACDSNDNIYASFLDFREPQISGVSAHGHVYFTKSTDGGITWSMNKKVDIMPGGVGGTCECCAQHIAVSPTGNIYIGFRSNIQELRNIYLTRSTDGGETFQTSLKVADGDWSLTGCPMKGPNIQLDESETLHLTWGDARDGKLHLYYAAVPKGSTEVPVNLKFDDTLATVINYPDVAVYNNGTVIALAYQTLKGITYLLTNGERVLANNTLLPSGNSQAYVSLRFNSDGIRYLCYQDSKAGSPDIYFCKEAMPLAQLAVQKNPIEKEITIFPNPLTETRSFMLSYTGKQSLSLKIVNVLGKEVFQTTVLPSIESRRIELPELSAGSYYCIFTGPNVHMTRSLLID